MNTYVYPYVVPQGVQDIKDALAGALAEQRRCYITFMVERAGAFNEIQMPGGAFFDDFGFYAGQFHFQIP